MEMEKLEIERDQLREERDAFQAQSLTVAEEASYARDLASAAAVELRNLAQEVKKLSAQNNKLTAELAIARERAYSRAGYSGVNELFVASIATDRSEKYRMDATNSEETFYDDLSKDLLVRQEREAAFGSLVAEKALNQVEVWHRMEKAKRTEMDLENELTGMWVLASSLKKSIDSDDSIRTSFQGFPSLSDHLKNMDCMGDEYKYGTESMDFEDLLKEEGHNRAEPQTLVAQLKSEDLEELDLNSLEDLCALHVNALTRLRQAKAKVQKKLSKNRSECSLMGPEQCEDRHAHVCRVCSRVLMSALLLPCCHVSLCRLCAAACTDCPLCKHPIPDKLFLHFGE